MEVDRVDGRTPYQLRPLACSRNLLNRAHGSARDTIVLAAVYGPKAGTKKNENPEKASIEVVWKPKTGQIGKAEREYEMILRRTLLSICHLTINPNTTTSGYFSQLLPCAVNAACAALVDAGIPLKHLAVSICCGVSEAGSLVLDPSKAEEQKLQAFSYLVFPNSAQSLLSEESKQAEGEPMEHGIITSVTHGAMSGGAFGGNRGMRPVPPEKGVFPLDHMHECDLEKKEYISFLKTSGFQSEICRRFSKKDLECRMEKQFAETCKQNIKSREVIQQCLFNYDLSNYKPTPWLLINLFGKHTLSQ
ncbi:hypothetical protein MKW92_007956 [Papaver armeniacum]|nr:hypothetical protein MKW92_007956 [Papaver armeniacum]